MSTFIVGFVVCDYTHLETKTTKGLDFRIYLPKHIENQGEYGLKVGSQVIDYFADFFNVSYPMQKMDMISIPDFGVGAMENWGLITFRTTNLLFDAKAASSSAEERVAEVISHELGHQWFGNLVTMKWWSDLWLKEGFATFLAYLGMDHIYPEWRVWDHFPLESSHEGLRLDSLDTSHPIQAPVKDPSQIGSIFDSISYKKVTLTYSCSLKQLLH